MILAGDVGGTKVILALASPGEDGALEIVREERYASRDFGGLEEVVDAFLTGHPARIDAAAFGLACPVVGDACTMPNLGWAVDRRGIGRAFGIERVAILNDLEATAYGLDDLPEDRIATIQAGVERSRTTAILAPGTGLGAAILAHVDGRPVVLPSEGGHVEWAAPDAEGWALREWLREKHGRVSVERVVSGPGLLAIYAFLRDTKREEEPEWLAERLAAAGDPSAEISRAGLAGEAPICARALDVFVAACGSAAGDLALTALALGGVWLGGGIVPHIVPRLADGPFLAAFADKGRVAGVLAEVPVRVVLEPRTAVLGAARYAALGLDVPD